MQNILHILTYAHLGGCERNCEMYISASPEYHHKIIVLASQGPMSPIWEQQGVELVHLNRLHESWGLYRSLKNISNDIACAAIIYWSTAKMPIVRAAFRQQICTFAVHIGNPVALSLLSSFKFLLIHTLFRSGSTTILFCCSHHVQQSVLSNFFFNRFQSIVAYNPVRTLSQNPYIARNLEANDQLLIGMTARLDTIKDHDTLIRAFAQVLQTYPNAELWLIGDGELRHTLEQLCAQLGVREKVIFHGNVPNVYEYLQQLDLFVYSTTMSEGFGNVVAEAMANGLPCIVSDLPMMREIAGGEEQVVFFQPSEAGQFAEQILLLLGSEEKRKQLSESAFVRANSAFSAERYFSERMAFLLDN
jgi:glycosyltransferase involved in cell wall biosynthesis